MGGRLLYVVFKMRLASGQAWGDGTVTVNNQPKNSDLLTESQIEGVKAHLLDQARKGAAPTAQNVTPTWWQWLRSDDEPSPSPPAAEGKSEGADV